VKTIIAWRRQYIITRNLFSALLLCPATVICHDVIGGIAHKRGQDKKGVGGMCAAMAWQQQTKIERAGDLADKKHRRGRENAPLSRRFAASRILRASL
jgi:hypothetical protein